MAETIILYSTASEPSAPPRTPATVNDRSREYCCPFFVALIVIFTVFVAARVAPADTDIVTTPVFLSVAHRRFVSGVQVMLSRVSFSVPYHILTVVFQVCEDTTFPSEVRAALTISLSKSAMMAFSPSLLQRCTTAGSLNSDHTPFSLKRVQPHST